MQPLCQGDFGDKQLCVGGFNLDSLFGHQKNTAKPRWITRLPSPQLSPGGRGSSLRSLWRERVGVEGDGVAVHFATAEIWFKKPIGRIRFTHQKNARGRFSCISCRFQFETSRLPCFAATELRAAHEIRQLGRWHGNCERERNTPLLFSAMRALWAVLETSF